MWVPEMNAALGDPLGGMIGFFRFGMILAGGWFIFAAAPLHKPDDWTPAKQKEIDRAREHFKRKRGI